MGKQKAEKTFVVLWVLPVHRVHRAEGWRGGRGLVKHQHSSKVTSYRLVPPNTRVNNQVINKCMTT